jgi:hypothetical protein
MAILPLLLRLMPNAYFLSTVSTSPFQNQHFFKQDKVFQLLKRVKYKGWEYEASGRVPT